ncbi:MAG: gamma-glutamyl-gamma-aminobutyrate hydrolase family protein [Solirubrobacteraceae bacterium]
MTRPLVGITTAELVLPAGGEREEGHPGQQKVALGLDYPQAVWAGGGMPVVLSPVFDDVTAVLDRLDALVVSGGPDLTSVLYGAAPHPALGPTDEDVDRWELALVRRALDVDLPILAICRGMQVLNVACGGTLWQDLPSEQGIEGHRQRAHGTEVTHDVEVEADTRLATICGAGRLAVNTFHHQAARDIGERLSVTARAEDGVVEGLEDPHGRFVVGVQWHAESLIARPAHLALFAALADAADGRSGPAT